MDIKILKANETGYGFLIEGDAGFISPLDERNKNIIREFEKIDLKSSTSDKLIVYVVLQKYNVKNRNGRIYPEDILRKQNEIYQQNIRERRAVGECVTRDTEILTSTGWKNITDVVAGEKIFTLNVNKNEIELQPISYTIEKKYNDELVHIYNKKCSLDMKLTKNHKMILWDRYNKPYELTAIEFYEKLKNKNSTLSHSSIHYGGNWNGKNEEFFILPNTDIKIDIKDWAAFLGIFIAEGHTSGSRGGKTINNVIITQTKSVQQEKLIELLNRLPFKYRVSNNRQFIITDKNLYEHLKVLGNSWEKYIPNYAKNWSVEILNILFEWLLMGDGRNRHNLKGELLREYYTTSKKLADDVYEIILKLGSGASINTRIQTDRYIIDNEVENEVEDENGTVSVISKKIKRKILASNSKPLYIVSEKNSSSISLDNRFIKAELEKINDNVYCVSVPNNTWLMRYNNASAWTHNCDHPESSVISADRISHNIIETWWEDHTLMGKMEILMTKGYQTYGIVSTKGDLVADLLRHNIMIGVSSRGVGSLKEVKGDLIVQDDFELICWDVVTAPSTPGSWVFKNREESKPYVENRIIKKERLIESIDRFLID
jgi:hypothetical protein